MTQTLYVNKVKGASLLYKLAELQRNVNGVNQAIGEVLLTRTVGLRNPRVSRPGRSPHNPRPNGLGKRSMNKKKRHSYSQYTIPQDQLTNKDNLSLYKVACLFKVALMSNTTETNQLPKKTLQPKLAATGWLQDSYNTASNWLKDKYNSTVDWAKNNPRHAGAIGSAILGSTLFGSLGSRINRPLGLLSALLGGSLFAKLGYDYTPDVINWFKKK